MRVRGVGSAAAPTMIGRSRHVVLGFTALAGVVIFGTVGYVLLGFGFLDALYRRSPP